MHANKRIRNPVAERFRLLTASLVFFLGVATAIVDAKGTIVGTEGARFTIDSKPTFLLGVSYYGALGAPEEFVRQDLDDLQRHGFNWLRVWATWESRGDDVSAVDPRGEPRKNFMDRLQWLVAECDRRGVIVDVTLARGKGVGRLPDLDSHCRAVESLSLALKQNRNWYVDLANERDVRDDRYVSPEDLKTLRAALRRIDPLRLATASFGGHDLDERDLRDALVTAELDFVCPHRPRHSRSSAETEVQTRQCLSLMRKSDKVVPVLYQEPFRRGYTAWEPTAADFLTDLRGAVSGGAAGWCLHNGTQKDAPDMSPRRSFDLRGRRLFEQLDSEELKVVQDAASTARQSIPVGER